MSPADLEGLGVEMMLCNAYHLYLRPGHPFVEKKGGLHKFIAWRRPILTDSGGYQVFSLNALSKISEEGASFQSLIDGSRPFVCPDTAM